MNGIVKSRRWPRSTPVLESSDICRDNMTFGEKHCLLGWAQAVFSSYKTNKEIEACTEYNLISRCVKRALINEICASQRIPYPVKFDCTLTHTGFFDDVIINFNDSTGISKARIARIWNLTMARLGYVKNNPEAHKCVKK